MRLIFHGNNVRIDKALSTGELLPKSGGFACLGVACRAQMQGFSAVASCAHCHIPSATQPARALNSSHLTQLILPTERDLSVSVMTNRQRSD